MSSRADQVLGLARSLASSLTGCDPSPVEDHLAVEGVTVADPEPAEVQRWLDQLILPTPALDLLPSLRRAQVSEGHVDATSWHVASNLLAATAGHYGLPDPAQRPIPDGPLVYAVDLDETCYGWMEPFIERTSQVLGVPVEKLRRTSSYDPFLAWGLGWEGFHRINREMILDGTAFTTGPMIENALAGVRALKEAGHTVLAVTARGEPGLEEETRRGSQQWIDEFGFGFDDLIFERDKTRVPFDVLVDDSPYNVTHAVEAERNAIVFSATWNHQLGPGVGRYRAFGWEHVLRHAGIEVPW